MTIIADTLEKKTLFKTQSRAQKTIKTKVSFSGNGLFTGQVVNVTLLPADPGTGVVFERIDLEEKPAIAATVNSLLATPRCTILGTKTFQVICVEHLLSAVAALGIDNLLIQIDGGEIPICDGSAINFVQLLTEANVVEQEQQVEEYLLQKPLFLDVDGMQIIALPSSHRQYSFTLSYPGHPILGAQFHHFDTLKDSYEVDIAKARTFSPLQEVKVLIEKGLIKSDSLDHGVIVDGAKILNPEGLFYPNEMVRHKILDMIGDLSLSGFFVIAHFIGVKSGHALNTSFAKLLRQKVLEEN